MGEISREITSMGSGGQKNKATQTTQGCGVFNPSALCSAATLLDKLHISVSGKAFISGRVSFVHPITARSGFVISVVLEMRRSAHCSGWNRCQAGVLDWRKSTKTRWRHTQRQHIMHDTRGRNIQRFSVWRCHHLLLRPSVSATTIFRVLPSETLARRVASRYCSFAITGIRYCVSADETTRHLYRAKTPFLAITARKDGVQSQPTPFRRVAVYPVYCSAALPLPFSI